MLALHRVARENRTRMAIIHEQSDPISPTPTGKHEKERRWRRHDVTIPVRVTLVHKGERFSLHGQACDVSTGGMRLFLPKELEEGCSVRMEFVLPYASPKLEIRGIVRNRKGFQHGVEFVNPSPGQRQMIERTCKTFSLLD